LDCIIHGTGHDPKSPLQPRLRRDRCRLDLPFRCSDFVRVVESAFTDLVFACPLLKMLVLQDPVVGHPPFLQVSELLTERSLPSKEQQGPCALHAGMEFTVFRKMEGSVPYQELMRIYMSFFRFHSDDKVVIISMNQALMSKICSSCEAVLKVDLSTAVNDLREKAGLAMACMLGGWVRSIEEAVAARKKLVCRRFYTGPPVCTRIDPNKGVTDVKVVLFKCKNLQD
jgi:hypothetical protein